MSAIPHSYVILSEIGFWFALVMGLVVGSFLNVIIHRVPKAIKSDGIDAVDDDNPFNILNCLLSPPSTTPCCNTLIAWWDNVPLIAWIRLKGECSHCGAAISPRYVLVELATGCAFVWAFLAFGQSWAAIFYCLFFALLISLFCIDLETYFLPDCLTYPLLWLGLLGAAFDLLPLTSAQAVVGAAVGYLAIWATDATYYLWRKRHGFGGGDFKLLAALGAWLGIQSIIPILLIASVLAIIAIGLWGILQKERFSLERMLPFGPFLILAGCCLLFAGDLIF